MIRLPRNSRPSTRKPPAPRPERPGVEQLEVRNLLSTTLLGPAAGTVLNPAAHTTVGTASVYQPNAAPLLPLAIRDAYGVNLLQFQSGGNYITGDGSGQTIAIVDAAKDPFIALDLATFDSYFSLPAPPSFHVLNENGGTSLASVPLSPLGSSDWALEESLDVEWAHTIAPGANIVLFEAKSINFSDLGTAELSAANPATYAALGIPAAGVISNSWGTPEVKLNAATEQADDSQYWQPASTTASLLFAAGDIGIQSYPSSSPYVLSVGGTRVNLANTPFGVRWKSEVAWSPDTQSTGGGTSYFEPIPSYQAGNPNISGSFRETPDVSADADPDSGVPVTDTWDFPGETYTYSIGGTSLATPLWAGLLADVNQGRALAGEGVLVNANAAVYQVPASDFHDITSGNNQVATAGPGYDEVTGIGSPIANKLVYDLVNVASPAVTFGSSSGSDDGPAIAAVASDCRASTPDVTLVSVAASGSVAASLAPAASLPRELAVTPVTVTAPTTSQVVRTDATAKVTALPTVTASVLQGFHDSPESVVSPRDTSSADSGLPAVPAGSVLLAIPGTPAEDAGAVPPATPPGTPSDAVFADPSTLPASTVATPVLAGEEAHPTDPAMVAGLALAVGGSWSAAARSEENRKNPALRRKPLVAG